MSRTYRKNTRWYYKIRGEFVTHYRDRTVKGDPRNFRQSRSYIWNGSNPHIDVNEDYRYGGGFYKEVLVGDSDNFNRSAGKERKKMYHRIDRARFRQALYHNEDAHIKTSMNPWDWD